MSDGLGWDGISPDRSISRSPSGDKNYVSCRWRLLDNITGFDLPATVDEQGVGGGFGGVVQERKQ